MANKIILGVLGGIALIAIVLGFTVVGTYNGLVLTRQRKHSGARLKTPTSGAPIWCRTWLQPSRAPPTSNSKH